jgi:membrane-associated protease RseP (regulator of RpoE activity)
VVFVAFTGEEMGLLGSAHFAARGSIAPARMKAMLNMDMVGRLGSGPLIVYGVGTAHEWQGLVEDAARDAGVAVATRTEGYGPSDHTSFYARDVPVLHFFTNVHADYHQPGDDWEKIDADGLVKVARMVSTITADLASRPMSLVLVQGAGTPPAQAGEGQSRGYGAYLGSVPDFTPVERGVLLSGVSPGSPAAQAGLRSGDVILGLGQHEVADLQGMTDALRAHKPGDTVEIRFLRDGRAERVTVTLSSRVR